MTKKAILWSAAAIAAVLVFWLIGFSAETLSMLDAQKVTALPQSSVVYDKDGNSAGRLSGSEDRRAIALDRIPDKVQKAFIAAEDARFYRHHGVDFYRIGGAILQNLKSGGYAQGASTITQQLIKLTHLSSEKSLRRKAQEALLALRLETVMSKRDILQAYLNTVYFGAGAYGIQSASQIYFGIPAESLTLAQGALLAGVIKSPSRYAPHLNEENARKRRNLVLNLMADQGYITLEEAQSAQSEPIEIVRSADHTEYAWYLDQAAEEAASLLGISYDDLLSGGYRIYTGLDPSMQKSVQNLFDRKNSFPSDASDGTPVQAAFVCMDSRDGTVRAVMGGREHRIARGLNRASGIKRQPGSAFKPISVYAAAIDRFGYLPTSFVDDTRRDFGGGYTPGNFGDKYYGTVTLRQALSRSLNVATVDLLSRTGIDAAMQYAERAGISLDREDRNLSMALGALTSGVSPMTLAGAYAPLSGSGMSVTPHLIRRIESPDGQTLYAFHADSRPVMSKVSARLMTDMLITAAKTGTAKALSGLSFPVAAKTGTVGMKNGNRDVWTVAYTPQTVVCVWMGFDHPDAQHILSNSVTGSGYPCRLAADFFASQRSAVSAGDFSIPNRLTRVLIDRRALEEDHRAMLVSDITPKAYAQEELYPVGAAPTQISDVWRVPSKIFDLKAQSEASGIRLSFTAVDDYALYRLYKDRDGQAELLAELSGKSGERLTFTDPEPGGTGYYVIPLEKTLLAEGVELAGAPSERVAPLPSERPGAVQASDPPVHPANPIF